MKGSTKKLNSLGQEKTRQKYLEGYLQGWKLPDFGIALQKQAKSKMQRVFVAFTSKNNKWSK